MKEIVDKNVAEGMRKQKKWYDRTTPKSDKVLLLLSTSTNKLLAQWKGLYKIVRLTGKVNNEVQIAKRKKKVYHINKLKKW